ncbi:hypothetical protein C4K26_1352 [Pseudomonas chlororaphis]|nr:hypothetical protein C4K26_1352 [Pseudomonas chlororaphis]
MRLVHYFYSTRKTQAHRCQPELVGSDRKRVLRDQAVGSRRQDRGARLGARAMLMGVGLFIIMGVAIRPLERRCSSGRMTLPRH